MIRRALILDLETTGVDPVKDRIVEVGLVLYSVAHHTVIRCGSFLVDAGVGNAAERVNRIPADALLVDGEGESAVWAAVRKWSADADVLLGHNARTFDLLFLPPELRDRLPLVDTCHDIAWPGRPGDAELERPGQGLVALALAHGLGVASAHRALTDCLLIAALLDRVHEHGHDVQAMLVHGLRPKALFVVADTGYSEERNALVKAAGFKWDQPDARRQWSRFRAIDDAGALPFAVREVR